MPTQQDYKAVLDKARELTEASRGTPRDWSGYSDPDNFDSQGNYTGPSGIKENPFAQEALDAGGYDKLLNNFANGLGIDIASDPFFWRHTEATGGDQAIDLGVGNTLYPNKSGWVTPEVAGGYTKGSVQNIGSLMYEKADTDAWKDKVAPGLGTLVSLAGAATGNPLLSAAGSAVGGGDAADIALAAIGGGLLGGGQAAVSVPSVVKDTAIAVNDLNQDPNGPEWPPEEFVLEEDLNGDLDEIFADWPFIIDTVFDKVPTETPSGPSDPTIGPSTPALPSPPSGPVVDDRPTSGSPTKDFLGLFLDTIGTLGDREARELAQDSPIAQGLLRNPKEDDRAPFMEMPVVRNYEPLDYFVTDR